MSESGPGSSASAGPGTSFSASAALGGADWPVRAADAVEGALDGLHDKVIRPLVVVGRAVVFGIIILTMTLVMSVLGAIAAVRALDSYRYPFDHRVWAAETLVGGLGALAGIVLWSMRTSKRAGEG